MKRIITIIIAAAIAASMLFSVTASAQEKSAAPTDSGATEDAISGATEATEADTATDSLQTEAGNNAPDESGENGEETAGGFFEELYRGITDNAEKVFSLLAFLASLFLGVSYKKGLIPGIRAGITAIEGELSRLKERSEGDCGRLTEGLSRLEEAVNGFAEKTEKLSERLISEGEMSLERKRMREALLGQTDMLYEIFMSSSLPHYEKEAVSKRIAALKEAIADEKQD